MKRLLLLIFFGFTTHYIFAASASIVSLSKDSSIISANKKIAIGHDQLILMNSLYNNLSVKDYQKLSGKKLNLAQKFEYFLIRHKIIKPKADNNGLIKFGGFMLGYLLGPIGVLIAFITSKDKNLRRWSLVGLGTLIITILIVFLTLQISIGAINWNMM